MDTQNTLVHIRLWNKDFWFLALANTLLSMAVYMQAVVVVEMMRRAGMGDQDIAKALGAYGLGLVLLGCFCSYMVQRYRRNHVCLLAIAAVAAWLLPVILQGGQGITRQWMIGIRLATGAFFGLAQMVLTSTLVIDTCEAPQRTEANYAAAWFGRFAVSLGPLTAVLLTTHFNLTTASWVSVWLALAAFVLVLLVPFPFRTPEDNVRLFSLDRFFLPQGWALFVNLLIVSVVLGMLMGSELTSSHFFAFLMLGFLLALIAEKYVFVNAELKSETVSGLILLGAAILILLLHRQSSPATVPLLVGVATGLIGSRFLLFFIKLSRHSKRGTSQSSFFLAWEMGVAFGMAVTFSDWPRQMATCCGCSPYEGILWTALALTVVALLLYVSFTHRWYLNHKNR